MTKKSKLKVFRTIFSYGKMAFTYDVRSSNAERARKLTGFAISDEFDNPEKVIIGETTELKSYCGETGFIIRIL